MTDNHIELIGAVVVSVITTIIGPIIYEYIKRKFFPANKENDIIREDLEKNLVIDQELSSISDELNSDRIWITQFHNGGHFLLSNKSIQKFSITYEITKPGVSSATQIFKEIPISLYSRAMNELLNSGFIFISDFEDPKIATFGLKTGAEATGTVATYVVALYDIATNRCIGSLGIDYSEKTELTHEQTDLLFEKSNRIAGYLSVFLKGH